MLSREVLKSDSMKEEILNYQEDQLKEIFKRAKLREQDIPQAVEDYLYLQNTGVFGDLVDTWEGRPTVGINSIIHENANQSCLIELFRTLRHYERGKEAYQKSKNWEEVYKDRSENEPFIDLVEEEFKVTLKDAKHLSKLTGITEEGLEEVITRARESKYIRALELAISYGANYKDLIEMEPQQFDLPKEWEGWGSNKKTSIEIALAHYFDLIEIDIHRPALRHIAEELEAPLAVVMDAYQKYK